MQGLLATWLIASLHLLALGVGLGAIVARSFALRRSRGAGDLRTVLAADNLWGVAALVWLATGLLRLFGPTDKGAAYYLASDAFRLKIALVIVVLLLELWPMIALIRLRIARGRGGSASLANASSLATVSTVQALLVVAIVFAATAVARGLGY